MRLVEVEAALAGVAGTLPPNGSGVEFSERLLIPLSVIGAAMRCDLSLHQYPNVASWLRTLPFGLLGRLAQACLEELDGLRLLGTNVPEFPRVVAETLNDARMGIVLAALLRSIPEEEVPNMPQLTLRLRVEWGLTG